MIRGWYIDYDDLVNNIYVPTPDPTPEVPPEPEYGTPEIPTPQQPDLQPGGDATTINIDMPILPTYNEWDGTDVLSSLDEIIRLLQQIDYDIVDQTRRLLGQLSTVSAQLYGVNNSVINGFSTMHDDFAWMGSVVDGAFEEALSYMERVLAKWFTWLEKRLVYDDFDDSEIVTWLKRIYQNIGNGTNTRPRDPVNDPTGIGDWLNNLVDNFITGLEDLFPDVAQRLADLFGGLAGKFPFSIPWDVVALLGLLASPPVVPVADVPIMGAGGVQVGTYHVDLTPYDAAFASVRLIMKISFALYLMAHTKDYMELLEGVVS